MLFPTRDLFESFNGGVSGKNVFKRSGSGTRKSQHHEIVTAILAGWRGHLQACGDFYLFNEPVAIERSLSLSCRLDKIHSAFHNICWPLQISRNLSSRDAFALQISTSNIRGKDSPN